MELLLSRYPARRANPAFNGEVRTAYVLRDYLTHNERLRNIERLRRKGKNKLADALQAETDWLVETGTLTAVPVAPQKAIATKKNLVRARKFETKTGSKPVEYRSPRGRIDAGLQLLPTKPKQTDLT